ncbi:hypothetical protein [Paraflavitalea pollutisoli]|uniref:hypothetical protein n=1 Tax=Paraflavitalea pollutisoli TaxID=3034143 RepID=UPI0023EC76CB|nr:hypothetical protein [Paraflavitalea sp. H1-2-19X]
MTYSRLMKDEVKYEKSIDVLIAKAENWLRQNEASNQVVNETPDNYGGKSPISGDSPPTLTERVNYLENGFIRFENVLLALAEFELSDKSPAAKLALANKLKAEGLGNIATQEPPKKTPKKRASSSEKKPPHEPTRD